VTVVGFDLGEARLAPDSIRRVANEAVEQWSDDSKVGLGLVNDWSTPNSPYIQVPEKTEPPIRVELMTYGLRNPRCTQCFQEVRVPVDQSCPFERIEELIEELEKLIRRDARARCEFEPGAGDAVTPVGGCASGQPRGS